MTESEFLDIAEDSLDKVEALIDRKLEETSLDIECIRSGHLLEIGFVENGAKIIISIQQPMQELWIAARSGGFHYRKEGDKWVNRRDGSEFFESLSALIDIQEVAQ